MTYFTPAIDKYFASWILRDTWHTGHPLDMARFYCFVRAVDHFSGPIKRKLDLDDPHLANYPEELRPKFARHLAGSDRNPRTYDEKALKEKIVLAVKRNHPEFDEIRAAELADKFVAKAMIILPALWYSGRGSFPNMNIQKWNPPLK
jgi:hypothetical protein